MHPPVRKPKILVVGNDSAVVGELQVQLTAMGYEPAGHVTQGEQAIALAGEKLPDLVLMDVKLAGVMDGITAADAIRKRFAIPVVFLMASADDDTLARARRAEPYGYIRKPFSVHVLDAVLELALNRHAGEIKLRQSEERLRLILLGSRDGVWDRDLISNEVYYSTCWFEMLGYADNELPPDSVWQSLMHPADYGRATRFVAQVDAGDAAHYELEIRMRHKAGHYVPVLSRGIVVRDANGKAIRVAGTDTDLTSRKQLEEKQRESERRFKTIFEAEPQCVKLLGPSGELLEMNPAGLAMLEAGSVDEARAHGLINFVLPEHRAAFGALHERVMNGEAGVLEFEIIGIRGTRRWLETHAAPMRDEAGHVTLVLGVTRDITDRKEAAAAVRLSHERFQIVGHATNDAIWDWDLATDTLWWNEGYRTLFGFPPEETDPSVTSWKNFIHPEDVGRVVHSIHEVIDCGGQAWSAEYRFRRRDGSYAEIFDRGYIIRDEQGKSVRMIGAMQDITARKRAEAQLRDSEQNLAITLQSIGDAVITTDAAGLITRMNATAERLTGWTLADAAGRHLPEVFRIVNTETRAPLINPVQRVMESGGVVAIANHIALIARDGREYQISDSAAPIRDAGGQVRGVVLIFSDVTEEYRVRQAYTRTSALLERTSELANVGGWELDVGAMKMFWSRETFRIHEMDPPVVPDLEDGIKLFAPEAQPIIRAAIRVAIDSGTPYDLELQKITAKGRPIWVRTQATAVMEGDKVVKLVGALHDITARKQAQIALYESEARYRSIVEWSPEPVAISRAGQIAYVNPAAIRMFAASAAQDLLGTLLFDRIHPDSRQRVQTWLARVDEGLTVGPLMELKFLRLDGAEIDAEIQSVSIVYDGAPAMHTSIRNITERIQSERALAEAQRRTTVLARLGRELAEASTPKAAAIHILDAAQQLLGWDAAWLQLSDAEQQHRVDVVNFDLIDGEIREVLHDPSFELPPSPMARRVKSEGPQLLLRDTEADASAKTPAYGGGRRSLSLMFIPIRLGGRFIGILSIQSYQRHAYDEADLALLTSLATHCAGALLRLQGIEALGASEERYRSLVEWSPDAVGVHCQGKLLYLNPAALKMLGPTPAKSVLGKSVLDLVHPDSVPIVRARLARIAAGNTELPMVEMKFLREDGTVIETEIQGTVIVYDGEPAMHVSVRDITARKQAEAARVSLEAQLRESQKMEAIGTLAGGVAHDFNNILATILGNVELAREDMKNNPHALESLEEIRKAGARARDLVQQILSFSRRQPTDREPIALAPVVEESVRLLRATLPSRVVLDVHAELDLPAVLANATQIEQVVINLVNNAVAAMQGEPGCIQIRMDSVVLDAVLADAHPGLLPLYLMHPGRTVRLAVSDTGMGMEATTVTRIFEPFFTTKPVNEGTGLGLSVVHGIVRGHEGAMEVDSQPGKGATFTLYLPCTEVPIDTSVCDERAPATGPSSSRDGGQRILYIDDDQSLLFLVQRLLTRRGYRISTYTNQHEALNALRVDPAAFDLVVTDYNMPGMSGLDVAREIRSIRADLTVAVASGFIDEALRAHAGKAGVRELIFKANTVEELCEAFVRLAQTVAEKSRGG